MPLKTWALTSYGKPFELLERPLPELKGTEVLVRNTYAGVCHSELHLAEGKWDIGGGKAWESPVDKLPCTLGHEMQGEVVGVGPDVEAADVRVGGQYVVFPWLGCGPGAKPAKTRKPCQMCTAGRENCCLKGQPAFFCDGNSMYGGYGSHAVVPHPKYLIDATMPPGLPKGIACVYVCSGLTAFGALKKIGTPPGGAGDVLIMGCGGLGLQAAQFAKALFGGPPRAADISPAARGAAEGVGCKVYDPSDPKALRQLHVDSKGGVYAAIDFVGSPKTAAFAADCCRRGGTVIVVGLMGGGALDLPLQSFPFRHLTVTGSLTGTLSEAHEMYALVRAGKVQPIPHSFRPIADLNAVHSELREGKYVGRCILRHDAAVEREGRM